MSDLIYMAYAILVLIAVAVLVLITVGGFLMAATVGWKARGSHRHRSASQKRSVPARLVTRVSGEVLSLALDAKSEWSERRIIRCLWLWSSPRIWCSTCGKQYGLAIASR